ncbi:MAG: chemotaxis protein CheB [Planctomycetes bacterium]|nr:chemotaxis protein CheB [Planctomycetota bacterium]
MPEQLNISNPVSRAFRAIAIGASAGGFEALSAILGGLSRKFTLPIFVAIHLHVTDEGRLAEQLGSVCAMRVRTPVDKERSRPGTVYVAPADYHMLIESDGTVALSIDERVNWSRPSIDVLFESAARAFRNTLAAVILTGANSDGTAGLMYVREAGGFAIAQNPESAEHPEMPRSAIESGVIDEILEPFDIGLRLRKFGGGN